MDIEELLQRLLLLTVVTLGPVLLLHGEVELIRVMSNALF